MDPALIALNRFGLGARLGEPARIQNPWQWLESQLDQAHTEIQGDEVPSPAGIDNVFREVRRTQRSQDRDATRQARRALREVLQAERTAVLTRRITTDTPFVERLVAFWSNHLCVSASAKQAVTGLAGLYEREVIRPHVFGRFSDMVLASAKHPAMLFYLDNLQSIGPESRGAQQASRRGRTRGLNENYARELLELHTLGVDGGFTQDDVEALARILTGWTVAGLGPNATTPRRFLFRKGIHQPDSKTVLGQEYGPAGVAEGEDAIRDLCGHPSTARFVATKLVRHFVADDPPQSAIDTVSRVFATSGGDLKEVSRSLIHLEEAWDPGTRKFRTPQDWLVAVLRAVNTHDIPRQVPEILRQLRHPLWGPSSPKGYGDTTNDWADPDALMNRAELARTLAKRMSRAALDPVQLIELVGHDESGVLPALVADKGIAHDERLALAVGGPAFQWR